MESTEGAVLSVSDGAGVALLAAARPAEWTSIILVKFKSAGPAGMTHRHHLGQALAHRMCTWSSQTRIQPLLCHAAAVHRGLGMVPSRCKAQAPQLLGNPGSLTRCAGCARLGSSGLAAVGSLGRGGGGSCARYRPRRGSVASRTTLVSIHGMRHARLCRRTMLTTAANRRAM